MTREFATAGRTAQMDNSARDQLAAVVETYGQTLCDDPRRCESLLRDLCGHCRKEIHVLVGAQKQDVPKELISGFPRIAFDVLRIRIAKQLHETVGMDQNAAAWAVDSWAVALGLISRVEVDRISAYQDTSSAGTEEAAVATVVANENTIIATPSPSATHEDRCHHCGRYAEPLVIWVEDDSHAPIVGLAGGQCQAARACLLNPHPIQARYRDRMDLVKGIRLRKATYFLVH